MSIDLRVVQVSEIDEIIDFEQKKLRDIVPDENERMIQSWHARWRKEALEHYLALGWSFLARDRSQPSPFSEEGLLVGYFIAQPLLFLEGQTQSLWVEHIQYTSLQVRDSLCELAYKLSREKHFQKVYFPSSPAIVNSVKPFGPSEWNPQAIQLKTTKAT